MVKSNITKVLVPMCLMMIVLSGGSIFSQFLLDDAEKIEKKEEKEPDKKEEKIQIPDHIAYNIRAVRIPDIKCAIKISWDVNPERVGEFVICRSNGVINSKKKALAADVIRTFSASTNNAIVDSNCTAGNYFYAVIPKNRYAEKKIELYPDINYTILPVVIHSADAQFAVTGIRAREVDNFKVRITWDMADKSGILYTLYRGTTVIDTETKLRNSDKIKVVADSGELIDDGIIESGTYYYAVTAKVLYGRENMVLMPDQNYTSIGIPITIIDKYEIESIKARATDGGVLVSWTYSGTRGEKYFRLFRSRDKVASADKVESKDIIINVDITENSYLDRTPERGEHYYGLIPLPATELERYILVGGVNITAKPVYSQGIHGGGDRKTVMAGDLDIILKRTFFRSRYKSAVKDLHDFIKGSDNEEEVAKARLFLGRSHIELGQYRKALDYLILSDVKKYYPRDAQFWEEFALSRIR